MYTKLSVEPDRFLSSGKKLNNMVNNYLKFGVVLTVLAFLYFIFAPIYGLGIILFIAGLVITIISGLVEILKIIKQKRKMTKEPKKNWFKGILIVIIMIALVVSMLVIDFYRRENSGCSRFHFVENIASNLNDAIEVLKAKHGSNITTEETIKKVVDKNGKIVSKTIYIVNEDPFSALDSEGNLYGQVLC